MSPATLPWHFDWDKRILLEWHGLGLSATKAQNRVKYYGETLSHASHRMPSHPSIDLELHAAGGTRIVAPLVFSRGCACVGAQFRRSNPRSTQTLSGVVRP
jgi:hypothetical protein